MREAIEFWFASGLSRGQVLRKVQDEYFNCYLRFSNAIKEFINDRAPEIEREEFVPRTWQSKLLDLLSEPPNRRTIIWVMDTVGGMGKSMLAEYLCTQKEGQVLTGKVNDMAQMLNEDKKIFIFDITRAMADKSDHLYTMAETIKNGRVISTKYQGATKTFPYPHVVFFANCMYDATKWSADRIKLINLDDAEWHRAAEVLVMPNNAGDVRDVIDPFAAGFL